MDEKYNFELQKLQDQQKNKQNKSLSKSNYNSNFDDYNSANYFMKKGREDDLENELNRLI